MIVIYCVLNAVILEFVSVEKSGLCFHVPRVERTRLVVSTVSTVGSWKCEDSAFGTRTRTWDPKNETFTFQLSRKRCSVVVDL